MLLRAAHVADRTFVVFLQALLPCNPSHLPLTVAGRVLPSTVEFGAVGRKGEGRRAFLVVPRLRDEKSQGAGAGCEGAAGDDPFLVDPLDPRPGDHPGLGGFECDLAEIGVPRTGKIIETRRGWYKSDAGTSRTPTVWVSRISILRTVTRLRSPTVKL